MGSEPRPSEGAINATVARSRPTGERDQQLLKGLRKAPRGYSTPSFHTLLRLSGPSSETSCAGQCHCL